MQDSQGTPHSSNVSQLFLGIFRDEIYNPSNVFIGLLPVRHAQKTYKVKCPEGVLKPLQLALMKLFEILPNV